MLTDTQDTQNTQDTQAAPAPTDPRRRYLCRHMFTDGHRCGSPALRQRDFCFYHHANRRPAPAPGKFRHLDAAEPFTLPIVERSEEHTSELPSLKHLVC